MDQLHLPLPDVRALDGLSRRSSWRRIDSLLARASMRACSWAATSAWTAGQLGPANRPTAISSSGFVALLAGDLERLLDDFDLAPGQGIVPAGAFHLRHQRFGKPAQLEFRHAGIQAGLAQPHQIDVRSKAAQERLVDRHAQTGS
jgi:hypothetical protein